MPTKRERDEATLLHPKALEQVLEMLEGFERVLRSAALAVETLDEKVRFRRAQQRLVEARQLALRSLFDYQDAHALRLARQEQES